MGWDFAKLLQNGKLTKLGKSPNLWDFLEISIWEVPGKKRFEAIWVGGNQNFPLKIPDLHTASTAQALLTDASEGDIYHMTTQTNCNCVEAGLVLLAFD